MDFDDDSMLFESPEPHDDCELAPSASAMDLDGSDMLFGSSDWQNSPPRLLKTASLDLQDSPEKPIAQTLRVEESSAISRIIDESEAMSPSVANGCPGPGTCAESASELGSAKRRVILKIETIFESMLDVLNAKRGMLTMRLKCRPRNQGSKTLSFQLIQYPAKSARVAWKFAVVVRILEHIYESLLSNSPISKRTPSLFLNQAVVDRYVDDIAFTFGVSRFALNVTAAAKGLVAGAFSVFRDGQQQRRLFNDSDETLVPNLHQLDSIDATAVRWILIVEKEATFRSLVSSKFWNEVKDQGVIITGKGYPDLATRKLVRALSQATATAHTDVRILGLVDSDPDGIGILSTYKYGSDSLAHETATLSNPNIQWLGVKMASVLPVEGNDTWNKPNPDIHGELGLLRLSLRDRRKATKMLENSVFDNDAAAEWKRELQMMLVLNVKAEIEILESRQGGLACWLKQHLCVDNR
ncbi:meiosis-specific topoisomerase Spo11 [Phyllosticta citribraziliensis]|uniref:DNA topoisomerase (ATP-hydrolyzing) n=1 Tax=Phyllosticta citribraziliensis TaxID=989973 RepID=A0ABR1MAG0_9PEZI